MTNNNEYISKKLKDDEYLENLTIKTIKNINDFKQMKPTQIKQVKDTHLIDRINKKIENEKSIKEHYKSLGYYGLPVTNVDENIKFINTSMTEPVGKEIEREFDSLLSKYIKEPSKLQLLKNKIDDDLTIDNKNFMKELVFNFVRYEPEIKKYSTRYVSMPYFYEFLKSILLEALNKKYPVGVDEKKKPEFLGTIPEAVETTPIKQSVKNINLGSNEPISVDDKNRFNQLMSPYLKYPIHLQAFNNLIDNDKSILPNVFRKQFINNFDDYMGDLNKYATDMNFDYKSFYELMKDLLIQKNQFLSVTNTYNMADNLGVGPEHIMSSFEKEEQLKNKQKAVEETLQPDPVEEQKKVNY